MGLIKCTIALFVCGMLTVPALAQYDYDDESLYPTVTGLELGVSGGIIDFSTDGVESDRGLATELRLRKPLGNHFSLSVGGGFAKQTFGPSGDRFTTDLYTASLHLGYELLPFSTISPFVYAGAGVLNFPLPQYSNDRYWDADGMFGGGLSFRVLPSVRLNVSGAYHMTTGDEFDRAKNEKADPYISAQAGVSFGLTTRMLYDEAYAAEAPIEQATISLQDQPSLKSMVEDQKFQSMLRKLDLDDRIEKLQIEMNTYDEMVALLQRAINRSDQLIAELEGKIAERGKKKINKYAQINK